MTNVSRVYLTTTPFEGGLNHQTAVPLDLRRRQQPAAKHSGYAPLHSSRKMTPTRVDMDSLFCYPHK